MVGAWSVSSIMAVFISTQDRLLGSGKVHCHLDPSPQLFGKGTVPQVVLQVTGDSLLCSFVNTCELWNTVRYFVIDEKKALCLTEHSSIVVKRFYTSNLVVLQVKEKKSLRLRISEPMVMDSATIEDVIGDYFRGSADCLRLLEVFSRKRSDGRWIGVSKH